jgi:predicted Zn finger-like uncharacterized protein
MIIIECPHCATRFRLDPQQLADSRSMLKCTRCRRVFPAPGNASPARPRPKTPPREENLSFTFDDDDDWRAPELTPEHVPEEQFLLNVPASDDAPTVVAPDVTRVAPAPLLRDDDPPDLDEATEADTDLPDAPRRGGVSVRSAFVFLLLVVGGYGALTWSLLDDPDWARRLSQSLPVIGKELRSRSSGEAVALVEVQGRYERTREGKLVFVITGKAVNQSAESLRGVQVLARLYDGGTRPLEEQVTPCGNPLEAKIRDLSVHQVAILRGIRPPPEFGVQPGGQCPFVSIFLDVPPGVGSFSAEVARAQRQASADRGSLMADRRDQRSAISDQHS